MQASPAGQRMVSTNQVPFRTSNSKRSGQNTGCLGSRADNFPSLHWSCNLNCRGWRGNIGQGCSIFGNRIYGCDSRVSLIGYCIAKFVVRMRRKIKIGNILNIQRRLCFTLCQIGCFDIIGKCAATTLLTLTAALPNWVIYCCSGNVAHPDSTKRATATDITSIRRRSPGRDHVLFWEFFDPR
jgi:hypothetical protein